jgi:general secretion pathway protein G
MSNKNLIIIICLIILAPLLLIMLLFSLRIWPIWLLLIIIGGVILYYRRNYIPDATGTTGQMKERLDDFFYSLNKSINSPSFKNFTKKLFLYPLIAIIGIAIIAIAGEFILSDYFKGRSTKKEMTEIADAISKYRYHQNKFPQDLQQIIGNNPLRKEWISDQWEKPYKYSVSPDGQNFLLVSQRNNGAKDNDISFDKNGDLNKN